MISLTELLQQTRPRPPVGPRLTSGLRDLDALLGDEGLEAGRLTEWVGPATSGKTGLLRAVVQRARAQGVAVGWVDAACALVAADWADDALAGPLWVVRPPTPDEGAFCAEVLLRTRSFGVVVLDGAPPLDDARGVRLQRMARLGASALVVVRPDAARRGGPVGLRLAFEPLAAPPADDPLQARAPLVWAVRVDRPRGGAPAAARRVHLVEPTPPRLAAWPITPDRPATRTRPGTRYGR
ncbi:MAG: hypothetical protein H6704_25900 [Myxococcales bacterium]|nr:hypothetical protein [Myxococcales bacterium]